MEKDILNRNIVSGSTAWMLKNLGFKGWVSGYYHENCYEAVPASGDALEYYEYECIGNRSGFVNENTFYRAAAPTLVEAFQFLVDKGYNITVKREAQAIAVTVKLDRISTFLGDTLDEALEQALKYITCDLGYE